MVFKDYQPITEKINSWSTFLPKETCNELKKVLESGWINTGKKERLLRQKLSEKFNFPYCVATNSCTSSLRASLAMLGVSKGDEVVSTPWTFIATNTSVLEQHAKPVFADINYGTLNIDPKSVAEKITDKTKAIICVHYGGNPCEMDELRKVVSDNDLPIIEDCAHALGSKYRGKYVGSDSDLACFSFQVVKVITSGDGGIIVTNKKNYYDELKKYVWYGVGKADEKIELPESLPESARIERMIDPLPDKIDVLGFKYNMNDIVATIALVGLDHIDEALKRRKEIGEMYRKELSGCSKVKLTNYSRDALPNYQIFPVHVDNRVEFAKHLMENSIEARVNNRRNDRYSIFGGKHNLPATERADKDVILIPIHSNLTDEHVEKIITTIKEYDERP